MTLTGRKLSTETKNKISENNGKYWSGKFRADETKNKIRVGNAKYTGEKKLKKCKVCKEPNMIAIFGSLCDNCKGAFRVYKELCIFKFNVYDYPEHFDLALIDKFGWYAASNAKAPNLNGISRDHRISISDGFRLNIDPLIISHMANCKLVQHTVNQKKNTKSSITLNELELEIKNMSS